MRSWPLRWFSFFIGERTTTREERERKSISWFSTISANTSGIRNRGEKSTKRDASTAGCLPGTSLLNPHKMYVRHIVIYFMKLFQSARRGHHFLPLYRPVCGAPPRTFITRNNRERRVGRRAASTMINVFTCCAGEKAKGRHIRGTDMARRDHRNEENAKILQALLRGTGRSNVPTIVE